MFFRRRPTITRSGAWARPKSFPATSPDSSSRISRAIPVVVPGVIVDSSTTSVPGVIYRPTFRMPSVSGVKSGIRSFGFSNGVWMASVTASHSAIIEKSDVQMNFTLRSVFLPLPTTFAISSSRPGSSPLRGLSPALSIAILYPELSESRWNPYTRSNAGASAKSTAAGIPT